MSNSIYVLSDADLLGLAAELVLVGAGVLVLLLDSFWRRGHSAAIPLSVLATLIAGALRWDFGSTWTSFGGLLESSALTAGIGLIVLIATLLGLLASGGYLARHRLRESEYSALLLWSAAGLLLMARATELVTLFLALELLSICLYALAAYQRRLAMSVEAGIKYFLLGAFVSAFALLGIALLYGDAGTTSLAELKSVGFSTMGSLGLLFLFCAFAFKMSLAPFHAWAPDVYQGAPTPFVAFLSVAPKAASAVVVLRLLELVPAGGLEERWPQLLAGLAILSMVAGNVLALVQRDIKRMLAYSGIAHMGYLLVPMVGLESVGYEAVALYLLAYTLMNAGAFAVVSLLYSSPGEQHLINDLGGWGYRFPLLSLCLTICMLSLGGIPPTLGFVGKYLVFISALEQGSLPLAVVVAATSVIGVFYYLRVVYTLYMRPEIKRSEDLRIDNWGRFAAVIAAAATLVLGLWPTALLSWAYDAVSAMM